jgi:hypothetical protein
MQEQKLQPRPDGTSIGIAFLRQRTKGDTEKYRKKRTSIDNSSCLKSCFSSLFTYIVDLYNSNKTYVHCEVVYPVENEKDNVIAFAMFSDTGMTRMERTFSDPSYVCIWITVTKEQYQRGYNFCMKNYTRNVSFDFSGMRRLPICPSPIPKKNAYWCASFTIDFLHQIDCLVYYRSNTLDVDDIYLLLQNGKRTIIGATSKEKTQIMNIIESGIA